MTNTALITGASSGIGRELARYHASKGGDLIITARRKTELNDLKSELEKTHGVLVTAIPHDLGAENGAEDLYEAISGQRIDVLINNAGFGGHGLFLERGLSQDIAMIDLNVKALVTLSHLIGNDMVNQGGGKILNVSSTARYVPGPLQATYYATKAYVSSFSLALAEELKGTGVTVTALEPGGVKTEFMETADLSGTRLGANSATAKSVAKIGYDAMVKGELSVINDRWFKFQLHWVVPFLPTRRILKMVRNLQEKVA